MKPLNLKETALKEEIKEILEELENMYEISELKEQVNNINKIRDYIINLQQENNQLKIQISAREEICNRLESNWNKLKEYIKKIYKGCPPYEKEVLMFLTDKMHELEQGEE